MRKALAGVGAERSKLMQFIEGGDVEGTRSCLAEEVSQKDRDVGLHAAVERLKSLVAEGSDDQSCFTTLAEVM